MLLDLLKSVISRYILVHQIPGEKTPTGAPKEIFGHGRAANAEAGAKGAEISSELDPTALTHTPAMMLFC